MAGAHSRRGNSPQYANNTGNRREDPFNKKKPTTGSGLPTPELETTNLPNTEPPRNNPNMSMPHQSQTTSRVGKAPERPQIAVPDIVPTDDMKSIGAILGAMKQNMAKLENAMQGIGKQATALTAIHAPLKLQEEYETVRQQLHQQIERQKEEIKQKRLELDGLLKRQLDEKIRQRIDAEVHEIVKQRVANRVHVELNKLIPEELKKQSYEHQNRTVQIGSNLINNEARRRNVMERTGRLHPLVVSRPAAVSRSSSGSTAYTPATAGVPPTPLDTTSSLLFSHGRRQPDDEVFAPSPAFPTISQELFSCYHKDRGKIQRLLADYEGPEVLIDLKNDIQVVNAIDRLGHNFGILRPGDHYMLPPVGGHQGRPLSPLIISAD